MSEFNSLIQVVFVPKFFAGLFLKASILIFDFCVCSEFVGLLLVLLDPYVI